MKTLHILRTDTGWRNMPLCGEFNLKTEDFTDEDKADCWRCLLYVGRLTPEQVWGPKRSQRDPAAMTPTNVQEPRSGAGEAR